MKPFAGRCRPAALAVLAWTTTTQAAVFLTETISSQFDLGSTLDGVSIVGTAFTLSATFDATAPVESGPGVALFAATSFTLNIAGAIYTTDPSLVTVYLESDGPGSSLPGMLFGYTPEFGPALGLVVQEFATTTPELDLSNLGPTIFSDYTRSLDFGFNIPLTPLGGGAAIPLQGAGAGPSLFPVFVAITTPVPEPAEYAAVAGLGLGVLALVRRSRRAPSPVDLTPPN